MDKTNSSWLKTLSIGFSVISFGITIAIIGYIVATTKQNQPASQSSPTSTIDETANWKTYAQSDFSLRYPQNWHITTCKGFEGILFDDKPRSCATEPSTFNVLVLKLKELDSSFLREREQNVVISERNILVDGKTFTQAEIDFSKDTNEGTPPIKYISTKINVNNAIYRIDLYNPDERKIFDQILSTFRFVE